MCIDEYNWMISWLSVLKSFRKVRLEQVKELDKVPVIIYKQYSSFHRTTTTRPHFGQQPLAI